MNLQDFTKKITLAALFGVLIYGSGNVNGQATLVVTATPDTLPCSGGSVNLDAVGTSTTTVLGSTFDGGTAGAGWVVSPAGVFTNPCGPSPSGTPHMWMGNTTAAPRTLQTSSLDVSCGGQVCFDFRMAIQGQASPCEGPDLYNEGVNLQYSIDGGTTWVNIAYFASNGDLLVTNPGTNNPQNSGGQTTAFTTWANYCFTIPAAAETATTMFRWFQSGSSGAVYDHWGIDEVQITAQTCFPYYYDWQHIAGSPDPASVSTNVNSTTSFECCYTNGLNDTICDTVEVFVESLPAPTVTVINPSCFGASTGEVTIDNPGGNGPYTVTLTGPGVNVTYNEGNGPPDAAGPYTGLAAGTYNYTSVGQAGCSFSGTIIITDGPPCCSVTATSTDPLCNGGNTGTATATPVGDAPFSYIWTGGATSQTASGLTSGTYTVIMTDNIGCMDTVDVTLTDPPALTGSSSSTDASCNGVCDGEIAFTAGGGTPAYQYSINNGSTFQAGNTFTGLCDGNYNNLIIEDANGCQLTFSETINEPTALTLAQTASSAATCGTNNGSVTVQASGGTPNYTYTLGATSNSTGIFTGLASGSHNVSVTDNNGCTQNLNITINSTAGPSPFVDVQTDVLCAGGFSGSVTIGVTGGSTPFQYSLDGGANQASNTFGVSAGSHTVTVTDANGCTGSVNFTIGQPSPLLISSAVTDASCSGVCDGSVTVTATGSTSPYEFSADGGLTFQSSNVLTGLCAGALNIVVKDVNGCLANDNVNIGEPTTVAATVAVSEPLCFDGCDGSFTITASGGTGPYTYSSNNGTTFQGSNVLSGLCAGEYDLVVEDANGCQLAILDTMTQPLQLVLTELASNPSNCGFNDGDITIGVTNGTSPYSFSLDGGPAQGVGFFPFLSAGLYMITVTDANGCADSSLFPISDQQLVSSLDFFQDPSCFNTCDGAVIVSSVNGAPPISYSYNNGVSQSSGLFGGLCAEVGYVTIQDNGLCIDNIPITLTEPDSVTYSVATTDILCNTGNTGAISFSGAAGGDGGPYEYSIDGGSNFVTTTTFSNLVAGTYDLVVRDGNGCLGTMSVTLNEPNPFTVAFNITDATCNGGSNGILLISATGSTSPYEYSIDNGATFQAGLSFFSLTAGNYDVVVRDANLCTFDTVAVIGEPTPITASYVATDALCNGDCDGTVTVTAAGGTPTYLYSPDAGVTQQSSNIINGLCAGVHTVRVTDDNGCTLDSNITINEPTLLSFTFDSTSTTCSAANGDVTFFATGGTPAYQYSANGGLTFSGSNVITGLSANTYDLVVEDANGCQATETITLENIVEPIISDVTVVHPLCAGTATGEVTVTGSAGVGTLLYSIDGINFSTVNVFTGLSAGTYTVTVQDANGCTAVDNTVTLTDPATLTFSSSAVNLTCTGNSTGSITVTASGGTPPYQYSFDNGATFQVSNSLNFIPAGTYDIVVEDANGCQASAQQTVTEPAPLVFNNFTIQQPSCNGICDGEISAIVSGGTNTGAYTFLWSNNLACSSCSQAVGVCDGTYTVIVEDDNGCSIDTTFTLTDPPVLPINGIAVTDALCNGDCNGTITITAPGAVLFSADSGQTFAASNVITGLCAGNYDIVAEDANGCQSFSNTTIDEPQPLSVNVPTFSETCFDDTISVSAFVQGGTMPYGYNWNTGQTTAVFDTTLTSAESFQVTVTDANGCTIVSSQTSVVISAALSLNVTVSADTICEADSTTLVAVPSGGQISGNPADYQYYWSTNDSINTITVSPNSFTSYVITIVDGCNDTVSQTVDVNVYQQPIVSFTGGTNGCVDHEVDLLNTTPPFMIGNNCEWTMGDGTTYTTCGSVNHVYTIPGCYDVTLSITSPEGCTEDTTYVDYICAYEQPTAGFAANPSSPTIIDPTVQFIDESDLADSYFWNFGGLGTDTLDEPTYTFPTDEASMYEVCLTVETVNGCVDTHCDTINVRDEFVVFVPNAFSPDGDGDNDIFLPILAGYDSETYELLIFDRWGELIFESHHSTIGWDGTVGGFDPKPDVYVWKLIVKSEFDAEAKEFHGHVTLVR